MKNFYDVRFTEVIHRRHRLTLSANSAEEAIAMATPDDNNYDEESMDSFDYSAELIDDEDHY